MVGRGKNSKHLVFTEAVSDYCGKREKAVRNEMGQRAEERRSVALDFI